MSSSTTILTNLQRKKYRMLKPYSFDYKNYNDDLINQYIEYKDLKNLRTAAIQELIINTQISFIDLTELLSNPNVKKIKFLTDTKISVRWLLFFSKLLKKNTFINEIELDLYMIRIFTNIQKMAWSFFLNTISCKLVKITNRQFSKDNTDLNNLMFSNSNLKEINLIREYDELDDYENIIKCILSSNMHLDRFTIDAMAIKEIDQNFFDCISKSETKAEINTLVLQLEKMFYKKCFIFIKNAYLFNVETIEINEIPDDQEEKIEINRTEFEETVIDFILNLSNDPLNTVKRVKMDIEISSETIFNLLKSNKYNAERMPRIFVNGHREIKIDYNNDDNTYKVNCLYENSIYSIGFYYFFKLIFKENSFDENNYTQLLYIIFNCPNKLGSLLIKYDDDIKEGFDNPKSIGERAESLVNRMMEIFYEFKKFNIPSKNIQIKYLLLEFNDAHPEFNIFYFTILEILVKMNIYIDRLTLRYCSVYEINDFMNKHKELGSLNIKNIDLHITEVNKEHIDKLFQYSHLLLGKIYLRYNREIDLITRREQAEHLILNYHLIDNSNFISLYRHDNPLLLKDKNNCFCNDKDIINFNQAIRDANEIEDNKKFIIKDLRYFYLSFVKTINIEVLYIMFSLLKEYKYCLTNSDFYRYNIKPSDSIKTINMYLEINLDRKFREKDGYCFQFIIIIKRYQELLFKRKNLKLLKLLQTKLKYSLV